MHAQVVGWGLTEPKEGVSVAAKRKQVAEFCEAVVGGPAVLCGASLGAAVAVDAVAGGVDPLVLWRAVQNSAVAGGDPDQLLLFTGAVSPYET